MSEVPKALRVSEVPEVLKAQEVLAQEFRVPGQEVELVVCAV